MSKQMLSLLCGCLAVLAADRAWSQSSVEPQPLAESWDYAPAMRELARQFAGQPGVAIHVGDALTTHPHLSQWARFGKGRSEHDQKVLQYFHTDENNERDGWWLARTIVCDRHGSYTASNGLRISQLLHGGRGRFPTLAKMLERHQPQVVVLRIGMHDISAGLKYDTYRSQMEQAIELILSRGAICIVSTLPPHSGNTDLGAAYNRGLRELAEKRKLPLIDLEKEILSRHPDNWQGTLVNRNDIQLTSFQGDANPAAAPTKENLQESGFLLLGWLTVRKLVEVRERVLIDRENR